MALSQLQCLDQNNINRRTNESKAEFFYCEEQRTALEVLLRDGRDAFNTFLQERNLRGFLSDPEVETLTRMVEPYDPGSDLYPADVEEDGEAPLSLHYWPDLSDMSTPQLDLGWPDCASYRGVTRTNVFSQPPLDGQAHIKEIVRKTITQAQKVIAVVMDSFTDVDIFRDLLEAGYKRKVSVYILLERSTVRHFLSMCTRANMHPGYLKNLRVRCAGGGDFFTHSCTQFRGRLGHRFMFVDGDRAVSGSYCYTWMSSRLDRHLITVVTGQAVDAFDRLFRELYVTSTAVDLRQVAMEPEPQPEPLPQLVPVAPTSVHVARKLHNPKYALLALGTNDTSPTSSSGQNNPKDTISQDATAAESKKGKRKRVNKEAPVESFPVHPALVNLEKAYLIPYLPTWPEPDPPSDVIGFINIRDTSRPTQVHLQRSERFETSQAIRFSSPFSMPKETLPEIALPRQLTHQEKVVQRTYPTEVSIQPETTAVEKPHPSPLPTGPSEAKVKSSETTVSTHTLKSEPNIETKKQHVSTDAKTSTNTTTQENATAYINTPTPVSNNASLIKPTDSTHPGKHPALVSKNSPVGQSAPTLNTYKDIGDTPSTQTSNAASLHDHARTSGNDCAINQRNDGPQKVSRSQDLGTTRQSPSKVEASSTLVSQDLGTTRQSPSEVDASSSIMVATLTCTASASSVSPTLLLLGECTSPSLTTSVSATQVTSSSSSTGLTPLVPDLCPSRSSRLDIDLVATCSPSLPLVPSTPPVLKPRTVHLLIDSCLRSDVWDQPQDRIVSGPQNLPGAGPLVDSSKPVVRQQVGDIVSETQIETEPDTIHTSKTESAKAPKLQDRSTMNTHSRSATKKELTDSKKTIEQRAQSILTANTLQANTRYCKESFAKELEGTNQAEDMVSLKKVSEYPSRMMITNKDCENVAIPRLAKVAQVQVKDNTVIDTHILKQNTEGTPGSLYVHVDVIPAQTQGGPCGVTTQNSNDEAVNHVHNKRNAAQCKVKEGSHTPEKQLRPNTLDLGTEGEPGSLAAPSCAFTPERVSPITCTSLAVSRTQTLDACPCFSPLQTPTPDVSDGYMTSWEDSTLSSTSEEYYECSESPHLEALLDQATGLGTLMTDGDLTTLLKNHDYTSTSVNTDTRSILNPAFINVPTCKSKEGEMIRSAALGISGTSASTTVSSSILLQSKEQGKYEGDPREERGKAVNEMWCRGATEAILATEQKGKTGTEVTKEDGGLTLPLEVTETTGRFNECLFDAPSTVDVHSDAHLSHHASPPTLPRSSSSSGSADKASPLVSPVPSPALTPTPRGAARPRTPQPEAETYTSVWVSSRGHRGEGERKNSSASAKRTKTEEPSSSHTEPGELTRKSGEDLWQDKQKHPEYSAEEVNMGRRSSEELRSAGETAEEVNMGRRSSEELRSAGETAEETLVPGASVAEMKPGPWVARDTEALRSAPNSPTWRHQPSRPHHPYPAPQMPGCHQPAIPLGGKADCGRPQTPDLNLAPRRTPFKRSASTGGTPRRSLYKEPVARGFVSGQPPEGQGSRPYPKSMPSFLHTYANSQSQLLSPAQPMAFNNQAAQTQGQPKNRQCSSAGDPEPGQEPSKALFSFSFGKLYTLKGLKDKVANASSQSKSRSSDSFLQGHKSTG